ncbi:MAG: glycosyltransferase [Rhodothermales bacterium]|nr:glycosyltransferase [Rhodothermales bacterium]
MYTASPPHPLGSGPGLDADADLIDLSVIIVNYNVREFLEQALRSVERACADLSVEIFVVDNNSADSSTSMVRSRFPRVHLIANTANTGFSKANNQAIRLARGRFLLILNPDTIVQEDTLSTMVRFMERHPDAGALGCKILNPDGTFAPESRRAFPTPSVAFYRLIGLSKLFPKSPVFARYNLSYIPNTETSEVDALSGSCMMVRRAALLFSREHAERLSQEQPGFSFDDLEHLNGSAGAGLLDEDFFMYGEDLDWCYRIQKAGWKIYYTPETQIIHYKGESTKKGELRYVQLFYGAMLLFTEKHFQSGYSWLIRPLLHVGIFIRAAAQVLINGYRRYRWPIVDAVVIYLLMLLAGILRFSSLDIAMPPLFLTVVIPIYVLSTVAGTAAAGGYRGSGHTRIRPIVVGNVLGIMTLATAAVFLPSIAFSRLVVLIAFSASLAFGFLMRVVLRVRRHLMRDGFHRAILVGGAGEANRLERTLISHPNPPCKLVGYVSLDDEPPRPAERMVPYLGALRHIRDFIRLQQIDAVVFASNGISNRVVFAQIQELRDLDIEFKILSESGKHIIGHSTVDDLSYPTRVTADYTLGRRRSQLGRRLFEVPVALIGITLHPLIVLCSDTWEQSRWFRGLRRRTRQFPAVLNGSRSLVGYRVNEPIAIPTEWNLKPGVFTITETLATDDPDDHEINRAYWFYVRHQCATLDLDIILHTIKKKLQR